MAKTKPAPVPTASEEPTAAERLHTLRSLLRHKIETSRAIVESLAKDLTDPAHFPLEVLAWSGRAFEAAAVLKIALEISKRLDTGESVVNVHAYLLGEALRGAKGGSSSTSPVSNAAAMYHVAALAEFEELLRYDAKKLAASQSPAVAS